MIGVVVTLIVLVTAAGVLAARSSGMPHTSQVSRTMPVGRSNSAAGREADVRNNALAKAALNANTTPAANTIPTAASSGQKQQLRQTVATLGSTASAADSKANTPLLFSASRPNTVKTNTAGGIPADSKSNRALGTSATNPHQQAANQPAASNSARSFSTFSSDPFSTTTNTTTTKKRQRGSVPAAVC